MQTRFYGYSQIGYTHDTYEDNTLWIHLYFQAYDMYADIFTRIMHYDPNIFEFDEC